MNNNNIDTTPTPKKKRKRKSVISQRRPKRRTTDDKLAANYNNLIKSKNKLKKENDILKVNLEDLQKQLHEYKELNIQLNERLQSYQIGNIDDNEENKDDSDIIIKINKNEIDEKVFFIVLKWVLHCNASTSKSYKGIEYVLKILGIDEQY